MIRGLLALLLCAALVACDGAALPGTRTSPTITVAPGLDGLRVEESVLARPGEGNAVEFSAVLANAGSVALEVRVEGEWRTGPGLARGGFSGTWSVEPGARVPISSASASDAVVALDLKVTPAGPPMPEWARGLLTAAGAGAVGAGVAWTPTPTLAEVPSWPPRGLANGVPFEARTLFFTRESQGWRFQLRDVAYDPLLPAGGSDPRVQTVYLDLPEEPAAGMRIVHGPRYGGAMFQILREPGGETTTSWNTEFALALEITDWSRAPYDVAAGGFQVRGRASGRIYVTFAQGASPLENSFVAGVFEDAPIVYYGPPAE
jgi:hypothetical protein